MSILFISHSSRNNDQAILVRDWLTAQGWTDIFLDFDPQSGIAAGKRWREALQQAGWRCSAVLALISPDWLASTESWVEYQLASAHGKLILPILIAPCSEAALPDESKRKLREIGDNQYIDLSDQATHDQGFERLRLSLQRAGLHPGSFPWPPADEPNRPIYPGLRALEEKDAAIFFGRDLHITRALDAIRQMRDGAPERMLVILGASGAGKSSFLKAGLLARLHQDSAHFLVLPCFRPGRAALTGPTGLQHAFGTTAPLNGAILNGCLDALRACAADNHRRLFPQGEENAALPPRTVILAIDQAEELFAAGDDLNATTEANAAIDLLAEIVNIDPHLLILAAIRSDSFAQLQGEKRLAAIVRRPFDLPRMPDAALKEIIEGPTRLPSSGLTVDADLIEQLIEDFAGADALPLLAFTLERLMVDHGADGRLEKREYVEEMKGVGGAIRKAVEQVFALAAEKPGLPKGRAALDELAQRCFVPGLVRVDDAVAAPKRRLARRCDLPPEALPLIDCFINQRLLVTDEQGTEPTVEVSHEAVLRHWPELAAWIIERRDDLFRAEGVMAAAHEWRVAQGIAQADALMHRGERLQAAEQLVHWTELRTLMGEESLAYLVACRTEENTQRKRQRRFRQWITGLVAAGTIASVTGATLFINYQRNFGRIQSLTLAYAAERLSHNGDYLHALRLSILAAHDNWLRPATPEAYASLASNAQSLNLLKSIKTSELKKIKGASFSENASKLLTWNDSTVWLWNLQIETLNYQKYQFKNEFIQDAIFINDKPLCCIRQFFSSEYFVWSPNHDIIKLNEADQADRSTPFEESHFSFSRNSNHIFNWRSDKTFRKWDAFTGSSNGNPLRLQMKNQLQGIDSPNGTLLLAWTDNTFQLWDTATGKALYLPIECTCRIKGACLSKDHTKVVTWHDDHTAIIWDVWSKPWKPIGFPLEHDDKVEGCQFDEDVNYIISWTKDGSAHLWDANSGTPFQYRHKHDNSITAVKQPSNNRLLYTFSNDGEIRIWDTNVKKTIIHSFKNSTTNRNGAIFQKKGKKFLTWGRDDYIRLWDTQTGILIDTAYEHGDTINGALLTQDGKHLLTWSSDGSIQFWNTETKIISDQLINHGSSIQGVTLSLDESRLLTWNKNNSLDLWAKASRKFEHVKSIQLAHGISGATFSRNGMLFVTKGVDGSTYLYNSTDGKALDHKYEHVGPIRGAFFYNNDNKLFTWGFDSGKIWDVKGETKTIPLLHNSIISGALLTKDEKRILMWGFDGIARWWDSNSGNQLGYIQHNKPINGAIYSKDGTILLTWGDDGTVRWWDGDTGQPLGQGQDFGSISGAIFSQDENRIIAWSNEGSICLWDVKTGKKIGQSLNGDKYIDVLISPDENKLLTWGLSDSLLLWDVHWAMRNPKEPNFIPDLCREKLVGVRHIDEIDVKAAPILRGREGEDVCAPPPTTWQSLLTLIRGH